ncbi:hypothetical protein LPJ38_36355 [Bradyrhizobium daqingense]|uniref:hypothetical protein n=1 Tax=Bradyrhizobium TaxID=374 RepID=UPI0011A52313|nr:MULTISPECIES: hypothetical protein [Bradyrhizobium]UFS88991.1 hypothetical protein LPJ38_36355 [Bradyrhizobium daqingense]
MSKIVAMFLFLLKAAAFVNAVGQAPMLSRNSGFNPAETIDWRRRFEILGVRSFLVRLPKRMQLSPPDVRHGFENSLE